MAKDRESRRDRAGVGPDPSDARRRLVSIEELDGYRVAEGEPDIRGWEVATLNGRELGSVHDLLIDPERGEVVMLELELRGDGVHAEVPLRDVQLDRSRKTVMVDSGDVDLGVRHDVRARDRMGDEDREHFRSRYGEGGARDVRYGTTRDAHEREGRDVVVDRDVAADREARRGDDADLRPDDARDGGQAAQRGTRQLDDNVEETVIERRPVIEEVVVRRRTLEEE
jgi:sporulation protein YlmC with PRC-barrel domain